MTDGAETVMGMWKVQKFSHLDLSWHLVVQVSWPSILLLPQECLQQTTYMRRFLPFTFY